MNPLRRPAVARRAAAVAAAALAGLVLSGCAVTREAGAAALIEGERVSVERLQELSQELTEAGAAVDPQTNQPLDMAEVQRRTLEKLIASRILADAAAVEGVDVSQGDVDARFAEFAQIAGGEQAVEQGLATARNVPPSYARQYVRDLLTSELLAQRLVPGADEDPEVLAQRQQELNDLLIARSGELDIEVNPRYGRWDPALGAVQGLVGGGLSRTAEEIAAAEAEPAPTPTP